MENLERMVGEHPFLRGLSQPDIQLVTGCASNIRFAEGDYLFRDGEEANAFYIIRQGRVTIETFVPQRGPVMIDTYGEGDVLGWSWLVPPYTWHFDARALELTRVIALDGRCLRKKCEEDHSLGYELLKRFTKIIEERLETLRLQLIDVYGAHS